MYACKSENGLKGIQTICFIQDPLKLLHDHLLNNLPSKGRLDIGSKLSSTAGTSEGFWRGIWTTASLRGRGTIPSPQKNLTLPEFNWMSSPGRPLSIRRDMDLNNINRWLSRHEDWSILSGPTVLPEDKQGNAPWTSIGPASTESESKRFYPTAALHFLLWEAIDESEFSLFNWNNVVKRYWHFATLTATK